MVIGVDTIPHLGVTEEVIKENNMTGKIQIINSKIEDLVLPDGLTEVDVIVSDWVGECLLHKSSLKDVILARDKFLTPGGLMFPDTSCLYITGVDDHLNQDAAISFWDHIYGFDMSAIASRIREEPQVVKLSPSQVMTNSTLLKEIDLYSQTITEEIDFLSPFQLNVLKKGYIRGFAIHFSIGFNHGVKRIKFSNSVDSGNDWKQTYLHLQDYLLCHRGDEIFGVFNMKSEENKLKIKFDLELKVSERKIKNVTNLKFSSTGRAQQSYQEQQVCDDLKERRHQEN